MSRWELEITIDHATDELTVTTREVAEDQHWTLLDRRTVPLHGQSARRALADVVVDLPLH